MRRSVVGVAVAALLVAGYASLDSADVAPGVLTTRPAPPPPPTETAGTRTLPVVAQPTPTTASGMPLSSLAGDAAAPSVAGITAAVAPVVKAPALTDAALVVRDGQTGAVLYDRGGKEPRIPASTTKMLSAAAVGQVFEPDETLTTRVVGVPSEGAVDRIVLVAGGDSLLAPGRGDPTAVAGHAGLADLADQVAAALKKQGRTSVTLSVDDTYAKGPPLATTWPSSFRAEGITGAVAMLGRSDQRALPGRPGPADPVAATRALFASLLVKRGIATTVDPSAAPAVTPANEALGAVESAPVRDQLALALTDSDNALTEILARQAAFRSAAPTDFPGTGAWVVAQIKALGIDTTGTVLKDASGLSRENRVTAKLLTDVLVLGHDGRHPVLQAALEGLPIGGLTGTLQDRFVSSATHGAAGRARAKTGTLTGANSLAGSVVTDDGRLLVYSGLVAGAGTIEARAALDRFVTAIAGCGCR